MIALGPFVVVGDVASDVVTRLAGPLDWHGDNTTSTRVTTGGAGANTAIWLARCGADVTLIARVGHDDAADAARRVLESAQVTCRFAVDPELRTGVVVSVVERDGERTLFADRGANRALAPPDIRLRSDGDAGHLHVSGYVLADPMSRPAALAALAQARAWSATTSVDAQGVTLLGPDDIAQYREWVRGVTFLLPNQAEVEHLGGIERLMRDGHRVVVTDGERGARMAGAGGLDIHVPGLSVECVDATGAGDAFNAGFLAGWRGTHGPERERKALEHGVRVASQAIQKIGATG